MDPPILVFGPNPLTPKANMVGNINDMKKLVRNIAHKPIQPGKKMPMITKPILIIE